MALAVVASLAGPVVRGAGPAAASEVPTGDVVAPAITFVDAQGRQHQITREFTHDGAANVRLVVARDRADGVADPTWGPDGRRELVPVPPPADLVRGNRCWPPPTAAPSRPRGSRPVATPPPAHVDHIAATGG